MARWGKEGWKGSWWRRVAGISSYQRGMEEAPENGKESLHSAHANGMNEGGPRNRWQDEVREDGKIVGGEGCQGKVHNRQEWKKLLRTAKNCCILHMPME